MPIGQPFEGKTVTSPSTKRTALRRAVAVGTAIALSASASVLSAGTANVVAQHPGAAAFEDGRYVVVLAEDALATYEGGIRGLAPTAPQRGQDLDASSPASRAYDAHLQARHQDVAAAVGATIDVDLTAAINGFVADLTAEQAEDLSRQAGVRSVEPNEILQVTTANDHLELEALWQQVGGMGEAGAGVVVGVLDTGIAPENPFFAGEPLGTPAGSEPYRDGDTIVFEKGDGGRVHRRLRDRLRLHRPGRLLHEDRRRPLLPRRLRRRPARHARAGFRRVHLAARR